MTGRCGWATWWGSNGLSQPLFLWGNASSPQTWWWWALSQLTSGRWQQYGLRDSSLRVWGCASKLSKQSLRIIEERCSVLTLVWEDCFHHFYKEIFHMKGLHVKLTADFSQQGKSEDVEWSIKHPKLMHPIKICFKNRGIMKIHHEIARVQRINHQQTLTIRNIKRNSFG